MPSILITGASRGIGRAVAAELAARGHRVVATARDPRDLADLAVDRRLRLDVSDQASVDAAVAQAGRIDVLISNAGAIFAAAVEASPAAEIERLIHAQHRGGDPLAQAVLPQMRRRRAGRLLFVSSVAGRTVRAGNGAYAATKWALEAFAETPAIEVAGFGIDVGLAEPGPVSSGALDEVLAYRLSDDPYADLFASSGVAAEDMISPEEVGVRLADLVDAPAIPLRVPVGPLAQRVMSAREAAPYDRPFIRPDQAHPLDNPVYSSLAGPQARYAQRRGNALRYPPDVSRFMALPEPAEVYAAPDASWCTDPGAARAGAGDPADAGRRRRYQGSRRDAVPACARVQHQRDPALRIPRVPTSPGHGVLVARPPADAQDASVA